MTNKEKIQEACNRLDKWILKVIDGDEKYFTDEELHTPNLDSLVACKRYLLNESTKIQFDRMDFRGLTLDGGGELFLEFSFGNVGITLKFENRKIQVLVFNATNLLFSYYDTQNF